MGIVIRQSLKGTFVNYIGVLLGLVTQFYIVTRFLDPEVIGLTKVLYEVSFFLSGFALLGSTSSGMRFFPYFKNEENGNNGFLFYSLLLPIIGCILMSLVFIGLEGPITSYFAKNSPTFNLYSHYVIPLMLMLTFWAWGESYANIHMRIAIPKAVREIGMRVFILIIYVSYGLGYIGVEGLIVAFIACYGICMLTTGIYSLHIGCSTLKHDWGFFTPDLSRKIGFYTVFLLVSAVSGNIMNQLDIFMLSGVKGLYSAGVYTIAVYMAEIVNMPARNITPISSPIAAEAMKNGDLHKAQELYQQVSIHQMLASTVLLVIVWVNLDCIFAVMPNGEKFAEGKYVVLLLGISKIIYGTLNFGNTLVSYSRYYYWTLYLTIFLTLMTIGTNLYFIPRMGVTGAALATLLACVISYSYQQYLVQCKVHANPFTWKHIRVIVVAAVMLGIDLILPSMESVSPWLDLCVRTSVLVAVGGVLIYRFRVSEPLNNLLRSYLIK